MIVTIENEKFDAKIDSAGAQLISLRCHQENGGGLELIWQRDPAYWPDSSPLLFPAVGNCRDDRTMFGNTWYPMPKHGFCRRREFAAARPSSDRAVFTTASDEQTHMHYPYDFTLSLIYTITERGLSITYEVSSQSRDTMYYCLGAHPALRCPLYEGQSFADYELEFEQEENTVSLCYDKEAGQFRAGSCGIRLDHTKTLPLSHDFFGANAVFFDQVRSRSVSLVHRETRKGVKAAFPGFSSIAFWTKGALQAPFLCIEPWNGSAIRSDEDDVFAHRHHVRTLAPGEGRTHLLELIPLL